MSTPSPLGRTVSHYRIVEKLVNIYMIPEFGPWSDSAPDGSRMFLRAASTDDIYALDLDFQ